MELYFFLAKAVIILVIFGITLLIATYSTYAERKVAAFIQDRIGPNRAGPWGLLQPIADAGKMFFKEDFIPANASKWLFIAGPSLAMVTACLTSCVVPFGSTLDLRFLGIENLVPVQGIDVNIGILYVFGLVSLGVYGVMIGGWASNNKFSLLGAIRAASQNISYELAMSLSIIAIIMMTGSLSINQIVEDQDAFWKWNVFRQPVGFIIFIVCAFAECNRTPFDLPECETELIGGYHTEYSSMKLGFYLFAEYINMFVSSAVISALLNKRSCRESMQVKLPAPLLHGTSGLSSQVTWALTPFSKPSQKKYHSYKSSPNKFTPSNYQPEEIQTGLNRLKTTYGWLGRRSSTWGPLIPV
jgi:NADH-quinone oxidoreductase subunit H